MCTRQVMSSVGASCKLAAHRAPRFLTNYQRHAANRGPAEHMQQRNGAALTIHQHPTFVELGTATEPVCLTGSLAHLPHSAGQNYQGDQANHAKRGSSAQQSALATKVVCRVITVLHCQLLPRTLARCWGSKAGLTSGAPCHALQGQRRGLVGREALLARHETRVLALNARAQLRHSAFLRSACTACGAGPTACCGLLPCRWPSCCGQRRRRRRGCLGSSGCLRRCCRSRGLLRRRWSAYGCGSGRRRRGCWEGRADVQARKAAAGRAAGAHVQAAQPRRLLRVPHAARAHLTAANPP